MRIFKKYLYLLLGISFLLVSCNSKNQMDIPDIVNDNIILSGIIIDNRIDKENNPLSPMISIFNPITEKRNTYNITVDKKGRFYIIFPVEINPSLAFVSFGHGEYYIMTFLIIREKNFLKIRFDTKGNMKVKLHNSIKVSSYDMTEVSNFYMEMESNHCAESNPSNYSFYDKSLEEYTRSVNENLNCRISAAIEKFKLVSTPIKEILIREFSFSFIRSYMFFYGECVSLKELNLNDKRNLLPGEAFNNLLNSILSNATLDIQEINDMPISSWIKETAKTLGELVGFEEGFFYDYLAIRSYMRQFEYQTKPLTALQKQNIKNYFENKAIIEILFKESEKIEKLAKFIGVPVINPTPDCSNEKLLEKILSKYAGKLVVVDFWTTWCGSCITATENMKELKSELYDKDVTFVYITNTSSPKNQWEKRIQGIGGEHYYLSEMQWNYLLNRFDFSNIPTFLLFDKEGVLKEKING